MFEVKVRPGDRFEHFKTGDKYKIISLFTWEPTKEEAVLYESEKTAERWGRTLKVFCEEIAHPKSGQQAPRFKKVTDADQPFYLYQVEEKCDERGQPYWVLHMTGEPVATFKDGNAALIMLSFMNMSRINPQRGDDYLSGVIAGCCHMTLLPPSQGGVGSTKQSPMNTPMTSAGKESTPGSSGTATTAPNGP
jgi:hypothetical protein